MSDPPAREPVCFLVFSASLREGSLNTRLTSLAAKVVAANGGEVDLASMAEFDCPSFNGDVHERAPNERPSTADRGACGARPWPGRALGQRR